MLTKLMLENFRSHKYLEIDLDKHITTIIGLNGKGKSNIIRAMRWVTHNRPTGKGFIRTGQKQCRVGIELDGHKILRARTEKENYYVLDKKRYKAFNTEVPEPIAQQLNIGDLNYQTQFDNPFWLSDSGGKVAKYLNQIVDLGAIDAILSDLAGSVRGAKAVTEVSKRRLEEAKERKQNLEWVVQATDDFAAIEQLQQQAAAVAQQALAIRALIAERSKYHALKTSADGAYSLASEIMRLARKSRKAQTRHARLSTIVEKIKHKKELLCQLDNKIESMETKLRKAMKGLCPVCGKKMS